MDGTCTRCAQNIPAWQTFTLGKGGRVYCSEYCQRLEEESADIPQPVRQAAEDNVRSANDLTSEDGEDGHGVPELAREASREAAPGSTARRRLRFLARLR